MDSESHSVSMLQFTRELCQKLYTDVDTVNREAVRKKTSKVFTGTLKRQLDHLNERLEEVDTEYPIQHVKRCVYSVLDNLERLCQWPSPIPQCYRMDQVFEPHWYHNLSNYEPISVQRTIGQLVEDKRVGAHVFRKELRESITDLIENIDPASISDNSGLGEFMIHESTPIYQPDHEEFIQSLYNVLIGHGLCKCHPQSQYPLVTNILLDFISSRKEGAQQEEIMSFDLMILDPHHSSRPPHYCRWQDTRISMRPKRRKTTVQFESVIDQQLQQYHDEHIVKELCHYLNTCKGKKMNLVASDKGLAYTGVIRISGFRTDAPSTSLESLIGAGRISHKMKTLLSFILARAQWQFYGSEWMKNIWNKSTVHFMFESRESDSKVIFINKPFLHSKLFSNVEDGNTLSLRSEVDATHIYPELLALGIMLLEIELDRGIESWLRSDTIDADPISASHEAAVTILGLRHIWPPRNADSVMVRVIEICIKPDLLVLGNSPAEVRQNFYHQILCPMEACFQRRWESADLSSTIHAISLQQSSIIRVLPTTFERPTRSVESQYIDSQASVLPLPQLPFRNLPIKPAGEDRRYSSFASQQWFNELDNLNWFISPDLSSNMVQTRPARIAVLDTGITQTYFDAVSSSIKGYEDFINHEHVKKQDLTQHGTNSIRLIHKVYENAEIYIARVFEDNSSNSDGTADLVAKAIYHAVEVWNADVIALPLGFSEEHLGIAKAVEFATAKDKLIFAAASNYGNLAHIAFPARLFDHVVCTYSTTAAGKPTCSFNPAARIKQDNFAFFGENVHIAPLPEPLSGTSISTLIGSAVAARLLNFTWQPDVKHSIQYRDRVKKLSGISAIFRHMMYRDNGYDCIIPWKILPNSVEDKVQVRQALAIKINSILEDIYRT